MRISQQKMLYFQRFENASKLAKIKWLIHGEIDNEVIQVRQIVSIKIEEIQPLIDEYIKKKCEFGNDIELHKTSKTSFLTYSVIRNGDISECECEKCGQKEAKSEE